MSGTFRKAQDFGRRRRPSELVIGILLLSLGVGGAAYMTRQGTEGKIKVVATLSPHLVGDILTGDDVSITEVSERSATQFIAASEIEKVVGMSVVQTISAGGPLPRQSVSSSPGDVIPTDNQSLTAVAMKSGMFPPSISAGSTVRVVSIGAVDPSDTTVRIFPGTPRVHEVSRQLESSDEYVVTLIGDVALGDFIARAGAVRLSIVSSRS